MTTEFVAWHVVQLQPSDTTGRRPSRSWVVLEQRAADEWSTGVVKVVFGPETKTRCHEWRESRP